MPSHFRIGEHVHGREASLDQPTSSNAVVDRMTPGGLPKLTCLFPVGCTNMPAQLPGGAFEPYCVFHRRQMRVRRERGEDSSGSGSQSMKAALALWEMKSDPPKRPERSLSQANEVTRVKLSKLQEADHIYKCPEPATYEESLSALDIAMLSEFLPKEHGTVGETRDSVGSAPPSPPAWNSVSDIEL